MRLVQDLLPPVVPKLFDRVRARTQSTGGILFGGDDEMFKRVVSRASVYGEYGVGASTDWVYENTGARIVAVDTSSAWAQSVAQGKDATRISIGAPNCGPVGDWGRPLTYDFRENFTAYLEYIWMRGPRPDTVLIDGRFRVCCFATCLLRADLGSKLLFDDYEARPQYHVVEELLKPVEKCGRQALFETNADVDQSLALELARDFRMVMD